MASVTNIVNGAAIILGKPLVKSYENDTGVVAETFREIYNIKRDYLLRSYLWKFSKHRVLLNPSSETPAFGWAYLYKWPSDFLRHIDINLTDGEYVVESEGILANASQIQLRYIRRITDPNKMDPMFIEALSAFLARVTAMKLTGKRTRLEAAAALFDDAISDARFVDSIEQEREILEINDWENARL